LVIEGGTKSTAMGGGEGSGRDLLELTVACAVRSARQQPDESGGPTGKAAAMVQR
jgi:hypothetical protein